MTPKKNDLNIFNIEPFDFPEVEPWSYEIEPWIVKEIEPWSIEHLESIK